MKGPLGFLRMTIIGLACTVLACGTSAPALDTPSMPRKAAGQSARTAATATATGAAESACPRGARWLGADPHVPLAVTADKRFLDLRDSACCSPWARRGERWHALDAWGRVEGVAEVVD